jgi:6-phosphogluconolactonase
MTSAIQPVVFRLPNAGEVASAAADAFYEKLGQILARKPEAHIVLTGGTVGIATLAAIGDHELAKSTNFSRVNFWWGDERFVASDSPDRNAGQARLALLRKIAIDESKIHEFPSTDEGLTLDAAAEVFTEHVLAIAPEFDLVFMGMGPDGHICSLFPGKPTPPAGVLVIAEHDSPKPPPERLSFTYEAINNAEEIWFLVAGSDKQDAVSVAFGDSPESLPVGRVRGKSKTVWFVDSGAGNATWGC